MEKMDNQLFETLQGLTLQKMYRKKREWISEVKFFSEDLKFVQHITERYLMEMVAHDNLDELREGIMRLQDVTSECQALHKDLTVHEEELANSASGKLTAKRAKEHAGMLKRLAWLRENFHSVKNEMFGIAEHVLKKEKKDSADLKYELLRNTHFDS